MSDEGLRTPTEAGEEVDRQARTSVHEAVRPAHLEAADAFDKLMTNVGSRTAGIDGMNDGLTKQDHFQIILQMAKDCRFTPEYVCFDTCYSSLENFKHLCAVAWHGLTRLKANRQVNPDGTGNGALSACAINNAGTRVHLKGYGFILVFRMYTPDGATELWATCDLLMTMDCRTTTAQQIWTIETYYRDIKQVCGVERCMVRSERGQRTHSGCALRTYLRLIWHELETGSTRFATKLAIIRPAIRQFLRDPSAVLAGFLQFTMTHT